MADFDRKAVEARLTATTPGPWAVPTANVFRVIAPEQPHTNPPMGLTPPYPWRIVADFDGPDGRAEDAEFVAHARSDLEGALERLTEFETALRRLVEISEREAMFVAEEDFDDALVAARAVLANLDRTDP